VRSRREGGWWIVTVDELEGVFSHAGRLEQVEGLIRDAIALWLDASPESFELLMLPPDIPNEAANAIVEAQRAPRREPVRSGRQALHVGVRARRPRA
jgi:predicted RNase H-like HicB family nuclease